MLYVQPVHFMIKNHDRKLKGIFLILCCLVVIFQVILKVFLISLVNM